MTNTYEPLDLNRFDGRHLTVDIVITAAIGVLLWYGSGISTTILTMHINCGIALPVHVIIALEIGRFAVFGLLVIAALFGALIWNRKSPVVRTYSLWLWNSFCATLVIAICSAYGAWMGIAYYWQAIS